MATPPSNPSLQIPLWLKDMISWIQSGGTQFMHDRAGFASAGEDGVDLTAPTGTPVYALATGPLLSANTFASQGQNHPGAVIGQQVNVPGLGPEDIYYQHIDLLPGFQTCLGGNCGGRILQAGQQIGTVGSAGETEVGFNAGGYGWGSLYGPKNVPGPWPTKPEPWIAALMGAGGPLSGTGSGAGGTGTPCGNSNCQPGEVCIPGVNVCWSVPVATGAQQTANQWQQTATNVTKATDYLTSKDFWIRVGIGIAAIVLVLWGLHAFVANTGAARKAEQVSQSAPGPEPLKDVAKAIDNANKQQSSQQQPSANIQPLSGGASEGAASGGAEAAEVAVV